MKTIYFVRHCTPDISVREDCIRPLNPQGMKDAVRLTECFAGMDVQRVVSSPYLRAVDTVRGIAESRALPVETDMDLRERAVGGWVEDFDSFARAQWADRDYALPGGESLNQVARRNRDALQRLLAHPAQTTMVGTHGTALCALLSSFDPDFGYEGFRRIQNVMPWVVQCTFDGESLVHWQTVDM